MHAEAEGWENEISGSSGYEKCMSLIHGLRAASFLIWHNSWQLKLPLCLPVFVVDRDAQSDNPTRLHHIQSTWLSHFLQQVKQSDLDKSCVPLTILTRSVDLDKFREMNRRPRSKIGDCNLVATHELYLSDSLDR